MSAGVGCLVYGFAQLLLHLAYFLVLLFFYPAYYVGWLLCPDRPQGFQRAWVHLTWHGDHLELALLPFTWLQRAPCHACHGRLVMFPILSCYQRSLVPGYLHVDVYIEDPKRGAQGVFGLKGNRAHFGGAEVDPHIKKECLYWADFHGTCTERSGKGQI